MRRRSFHLCLACYMTLQSHPLWSAHTSNNTTKYEAPSSAASLYVGSVDWNSSEEASAVLFDIIVQSLLWFGAELRPSARREQYAAVPVGPRAASRLLVVRPAENRPVESSRSGTKLWMKTVGVGVEFEKYNHWVRSVTSRGLRFCIIAKRSFTLIVSSASIIPGIPFASAGATWLKATTILSRLLVCSFPRLH